ncbi:MAG: recombinase RecA [Pseudanabaenaceae cyanobacterium]|jgi:recombination protein RecA
MAPKSTASSATVSNSAANTTPNAVTNAVTSSVASGGNGSQTSPAAAQPFKQTISPERRKVLDAILQKIEKDHGKGSIMRLGDATNMRVETIPTGSLTLDLALGGGLPKGRVIEVYGPESSGKTTLVLHAIAEVQRRGGIAAFVDAEHALDPYYAKALGVDIDNLLVSQPDSGEMALEIVDNLVRSMAVDLVAIDSVAALVPRAEIEGEMGDSHMGLQARLMSQALRKITANVGKANCIVIFLNQLRQKIGVTYGSPETTTGGTALKFYSSVRLDIRRIQTLKKGTEEYGIRAKVKVAKNKVAPPFRIAEFDIIFGKGISMLGCLLDLAEEMNILVRKGAWYSFNGENIGQGRDNTMKYMEERPEFAAMVESLVRAKLDAGVAVSATKPSPDAADLVEDEGLPEDF